MIEQLKLKPDFDRTVARFEAWWQGEIVDRAPVTLWVAPSRPYQGPVSTHRTQRERWLDVEYAVEAAVAAMERTDYVGDSFPILNPNVGPEITATLFGCELDFTADSSWSQPVVHELSGWHRIIESRPSFDNLYWRTVERMTDYAIEVCDGRFVPGITDLHGNYDILAALRDPQLLCVDLMDDPALIQRAGRHVAQAYVAAFNRLYDKIAAAGFGSTTWCPMYHAGPAYVPSCDFWCMVSAEIASELIFPDIVTETEPLARSIFHLDGPQALRHLDLLLDWPKLEAVQWVYGDGQGPAARWMDVYRRIVRAGKSVQLLAQDASDALAVLEEVGARGVWVTVGQGFATVEEAEAFLREVGRFS